MTECLTAAETEMGWVEFYCDAHGFLVATTPKAGVWCRCGKRARRFRHGRTLDPETLSPTSAKARTLNKSGSPFIHGCGDCGEDFRSRYVRERHRVGGSKTKRCLTLAEMEAKGWERDEGGRWGRPRTSFERHVAALPAS